MQRLLSGAALAVLLVASVSAQNRFTREEFDDGEGSEIAERAEEQFENRAFPADDITLQQLLGGYLAYQSVGKLPGGKKSNWQLVGSTQPFVPTLNTYSGRDTMYSGRVTTLALSPTCSPGNCSTKWSTTTAAPAGRT